MTGFVARVTRPVTLVNQELLTHPEYLISLPVLKIARKCTQDEENKNKKHNTICVGHRYANKHK
jgi:hypothetical protein